MNNTNSLFVNQVDIKDFFNKCGPTSTPRNSRRTMREKPNYGADQSAKDLVTYLLESKETWPFAFSIVCQDLLNNLRLPLGHDFLLHTNERDKSRRLSPMILRRTESKTRNRSMSPSGAKRMKESKWNNNGDIILILIEEILQNHTELPELFMTHKEFQTESKELLETLSKGTNLQSIIKKIPEINLCILGQCLRMLLEKMGVLLPDIISKQIMSLKSLTCTEGNKIIKLKDRLEAVQILLFNITPKSRLVLQKIINLLNIISKLKHVNLSLSQLSSILRPCLFEENNFDNLKLSSDFIILSDRIFDAPTEILPSLKKYLNSGPSLQIIPPLFEMKITKAPATKSNTSNIHTNSCVPTMKLNYLFPHSKNNCHVEKVVLTGIQKILSPDRNIKTEVVVQPAKKRKSFTDITKKIIEKSASPFRKKKEYTLPNFYNLKKSRFSEKE